jgi:hypothetical protein
MSTEYGLVFKTQDNSDNIDGAAAVFSPSLEADDYSESHEFDRVIPNPKVCYRVHKKTWLLAIRRQTIQYISSHSIYLTYLSSLRLGFPTKNTHEFLSFPQGVPLPGNPTFLKLITRVTF